MRPHEHFKSFAIALLGSFEQLPIVKGFRGLVQGDSSDQTGRRGRAVSSWLQAVVSSRVSCRPPGGVTQPPALPMQNAAAPSVQDWQRYVFAFQADRASEPVLPLQEQQLPLMSTELILTQATVHEPTALLPVSSSP